ncbi:molybdenum cofactor guanylyltransferase [Prosthecobacter fusiformis]|uniref:Probable molybdenum cofactor guanylyltransferase n=1 Tax=Prosthecobacter fusiformis TaxID=48464 RepID=A0A4R7RYW2_9BACT|nr:molybdenum cofactor guanylyltransferase [Prosthecobacter fusiformis]TDU71092.1 molybdenum cofactor guanylyltransferase [Prosthecobacter fusiformis]
MMSDTPFSALLLAGGRSVRMGQDKALLEWAGKPLWQVQLAKLRVNRPERLLIACREEQGLQSGAESGVEWLFDPPGSDCGPMGPIIEALKRVQMPLLVLAVDMPQMTSTFLNEVIHGLADTSLFFSLGQGSEPLVGVYTPSLLPLLGEAMNKQQYSLRRVIEQGRDQGLAIILPLAQVDAVLFANANTPAEWQQTGK